MGDASQAAGLALADRPAGTHAKVISVDYPARPPSTRIRRRSRDALAAYEALLQNGTPPSDIVFAGESAGGGLAGRHPWSTPAITGLPLPAAAFVMSPYADLTLAGATMETKAEVDPLMSRERMQPRIPRLQPRGPRRPLLAS